MRMYCKFSTSYSFTQSTKKLLKIGFLNKYLKFCAFKQDISISETFLVWVNNLLKILSYPHIFGKTPFTCITLSTHNPTFVLFFHLICKGENRGSFGGFVIPI